MAQATQVYHKRDLYSDVTSRILTELETGAAPPWIKPWSATPGLNHPHNAMSHRPYSGCNMPFGFRKNDAALSHAIFR